jgi:hypothetical protein
MTEPIHPVQLEGLRRMTPARKLELLCDLYQAGIRWRGGLEPAASGLATRGTGARGAQVFAPCRT